MRADSASATRASDSADSTDSAALEVGVTLGEAPADRDEDGVGDEVDVAVALTVLVPVLVGEGVRVELRVSGSDAVCELGAVTLGVVLALPVPVCVGELLPVLLDVEVAVNEDAADWVREALPVADTEAARLGDKAGLPERLLELDDTGDVPEDVPDAATDLVAAGLYVPLTVTLPEAVIDKDEPAAPEWLADTVAEPVAV
jgi:hypothetical protein